MEAKVQEGKCGLQFLEDATKVCYAIQSHRIEDCLAEGFYGTSHGPNLDPLAASVSTTTYVTAQ